MTFKEKLEKILARAIEHGYLDGLSGKTSPDIHCKAEAQTLSYQIISLIEKDVIGRAKSNEQFMKELSSTSSDWTYGHSHGWNNLREKQRKIIKL